jgi:hypothetical protein
VSVERGIVPEYEVKFPRQTKSLLQFMTDRKIRKTYLMIAADILKQCSESQSLDLPEFSDQREKGWSARWSRLCKLIQVGGSVGIQRRVSCHSHPGSL